MTNLVVLANDLIDWIGDRRELFIAAWTPELSGSLSEQLYDVMVETMLAQGTEFDFAKRVGTVDRSIAERFFNVNLKLARAAARSIREARNASLFTYRRTAMMGDGHSALSGIVLPRVHAFWRRWLPPLDKDCRCDTILMTQSQFERSGLKITSENDLAERESRLSAAWPPAFNKLLEFRVSID